MFILIINSNGKSGVNPEQVKDPAVYESAPAVC